MCLFLCLWCGAVGIGTSVQADHISKAETFDAGNGALCRLLSHAWPAFLSSGSEGVGTSAEVPHVGGSLSVYAILELLHAESDTKEVTVHLPCFSAKQMVPCSRVCLWRELCGKMNERWLYFLHCVYMFARARARVCVCVCVGRLLLISLECSALLPVRNGIPAPYSSRPVAFQCEFNPRRFATPVFGIPVATGDKRPPLPSLSPLPLYFVSL